MATKKEDDGRARGRVIVNGARWCVMLTETQARRLAPAGQDIVIVVGATRYVARVAKIAINTAGNGDGVNQIVAVLTAAGCHLGSKIVFNAAPGGGFAIEPY